MAQWWEHTPPTNVARIRFWGLASYVGWVCCWFSSLLRGFFSGYSGFPPSTENNISEFQFNLEKVERRATPYVPLKFPFILFFYLNIKKFSLGDIISYLPLIFLPKLIYNRVRVWPLRIKLYWVPTPPPHPAPSPAFSSPTSTGLIQPLLLRVNIFLWLSDALTVTVHALGCHLRFPNVGSWNESKGAGRWRREKANFFFSTPSPSFLFLPDTHPVGYILLPQSSSHHNPRWHKTFWKENTEHLLAPKIRRSAPQATNVAALFFFFFFFLMSKSEGISTQAWVISLFPLS